MSSVVTPQGLVQIFICRVLKIHCFSTRKRPEFVSTFWHEASNVDHNMTTAHHLTAYSQTERGKQFVQFYGLCTHIPGLHLETVGIPAARSGCQGPAAYVRSLMLPHAASKRLMQVKSKQVPD